MFIKLICIELSDLGPNTEDAEEEVPVDPRAGGTDLIRGRAIRDHLARRMNAQQV